MQNGQGDFGLLQLCSNDSSAIPHLVRMIKVALTMTPAQTGIGVTQGHRAEQAQRSSI